MKEKTCRTRITQNTWFYETNGKKFQPTKTHIFNSIMHILLQLSHSPTIIGKYIAETR